MQYKGSQPGSTSGINAVTQFYFLAKRTGYVVTFYQLLVLS